MKFLLTVTIIILFFCPPLARAQSYKVKPIIDYLPEYKEKHGIIIEELEKRTDLAHAQKYVMYQNDLSKLKEAFKTIRRIEYESKSIQLSVKNNCPTEINNGLKDCETSCLTAPSNDMYTQTDWIKVVGNTKETSVSSTDSSACISSKAMGKVRITATLYVTFKYKPEAITSLTDQDVNDLFTKIVVLKPEYLN